MARRKTTTKRTTTTVRKASPGGHRGSWGGPRPGAGRPPSPGSGAPHHARGTVRSSTPVELTVPFSPDVPSPRTKQAHRAIRMALAAGAEKSGFRLVHYGVLPERLLLIVEARDRDTLSRSVQGLLVSVARKLNAAWGREGKVFSDRYRDRVLRTPQEVRDALAETLTAARRRKLVRGGRTPDVYSSGAYFDGWKRADPLPESEDELVPVVAPKSSALRTGWRKLGLLALDETPASTLVPDGAPSQRRAKKAPGSKSAAKKTSRRTSTR